MPENDEFIKLMSFYLPGKPNHILRRNCLLKEVIEGKIKGRI
jgi:hypothetical protein